MSRMMRVVVLLIRFIFLVKEEGGGGAELTVSRSTLVTRWRKISSTSSCSSLFLLVPAVPKIPTYSNLPSLTLALSSSLPLSQYPLCQHGGVQNLEQQQ